MPYYKSISELIGNTPLVELSGIEATLCLNARILAKLESYNPAGSSKDRAAKNMLDDAREKGLLKPGQTIIEPTSGNTGIALAMVATALGYSVIIVMPDTMSKDRISLITAYSAKVILTDGKKGMAGAIEKANELARDIPGSYIPSQFTNPANPKAHYLSTGPEIWSDTKGDIAALVAGVGTGGTISGIGEYLKEKNPAIKVVAVEPSASDVLSGGKPGAHGIQGIGAGFVPKCLNLSVIDEVISVNDADARDTARLIASREGILTGFSAGAAAYAAITLAKRGEFSGKNIVTVFPDGADRYLSTGLYE